MPYGHRYTIRQALSSYKPLQKSTTNKEQEYEVQDTEQGSSDLVQEEIDLSFSIDVHVNSPDIARKDKESNA